MRPFGWRAITPPHQRASQTQPVEIDGVLKLGGKRITVKRVGTEPGGRDAAVAASPIETARLNGLTQHRLPRPRQPHEQPPALRFVQLREIDLCQYDAHGALALEPAHGFDQWSSRYRPPSWRRASIAGES